jgi:hypothetical protein
MRPPVRRTSRFLVAAVLGALLSLVPAAPASAAKNLISIFQDDRVLTREGPERRDFALDEMKLLGVDMIRTVVNWERVAPAARDRAVPAGLDLTNPAAYPAGEWDPFDELVKAANARGISVLMNPAGAMPDWASGCEENTYRVCLPNTALYGQFVTAVARRYSGFYPDENNGGQVLPKVTTWSLWNEPNLNSWITPQTLGTGKKQRRVAAKIYRDLAYAGIDALRSNGHADSKILLGETAPIGAPPKRTAPVQFYRDLFCIDEKGKALTGRAAKQMGCTKPRALDVQGLAHHPYVKGAGPPLPAKALKGAATVGTMDELKRVMRQGAARKMVPRKLPIWITEFGISTKPPDGKYGVKLSTAAAFLNQVDRYLWLDKDVVSTSQFEYEDDIALATLTFQTGLRFGDGTAKPGLTAYRVPVYVTTAKKKRVNVWGWVRAAEKGVQTVVIQNSPTSDGQWTDVATVKTDGYGFVSLKVKSRSGFWRLAWTAPSGEVVVSRVARVDRFNRAPSPGPSPPGPIQNPGGGPNPDPTPSPIPDPGGGGGGGVPDPNPNPDPEPPPPPPPAPVALNVNFVYEANASPLAIGKSASGTVSFVPAVPACTQTCSRNFTRGTVVTLTATAGQGSTFKGWGGACSSRGTQPTCTIPLQSTQTVTVAFQYTDIT